MKTSDPRRALQVPPPPPRAGADTVMHSPIAAAAAAAAACGRPATCAFPFPNAQMHFHIPVRAPQLFGQVVDLEKGAGEAVVHRFKALTAIVVRAAHAMRVCISRMGRPCDMCKPLVA